MSQRAQPALSASAASPTAASIARSVLPQALRLPAAGAFPANSRSHAEREADSVAGRIAASGNSAPPAVHAKTAAEGEQVPAAVAPVMRASGLALDDSTRGFMEQHLGHDFAHVRIHADDTAARSARMLNAAAYTYGSHIVFGAGRYAQSTPAGRALLAHELTHVVQQSGATPVVQREPADTSVPALEKQLQDKLRARAQLQREIESSQQKFVDERYKQRSEQTLQEEVPKMKAQAQGDVQTEIPSHGLKILKKAIDVVRGSGEFTLNVRFELTYQALSDQEGAKRAPDDIQRLEKTIGDAWTVDLSKGRYAGNKFKLVPKISFRTNSTKRSENALQINVRGKDDDPSTGTFWTGEISLAEAHLQGDRIIVVAHELYHLFGYFDAYFTMEMPSKDSPTGRKTEQNVGRADDAGRGDLLGLPDPALLKKGLQRGEISQKEYDRQTKNPLRVWEEDADAILYALGVAPTGAVKQAPPDPDAEDFEEKADAELDALRSEGEKKLADLRKRTQSAKESIDWLAKTERAMNMDKEIEALRRQILQAKSVGKPPAGSGGSTKP